MSAHAEFIRQIRPEVERLQQSRERALQLELLAGASEHLRQAVMNELAAHHAIRLERLDRELSRPPLDSLEF